MRRVVLILWLVVYLDVFIPTIKMQEAVVNADVKVALVTECKLIIN